MEKHFKPESAPLYCDIQNGQLIIRIGIDVLAFAAQDNDWFHVYDPNKRDWRQAWRVTDNDQFARDVRDEILNELEDGSSLLTNFLDKAFGQALDQGSLGVEEGEPAWPERTEDE